MLPGRVVSAGIAVALGVLAYGVFVERNAFTVRRVDVPVLDRGSNPIRVLHISDIHLAPWQTGKTSWLAELASLRPDVVVNTGDNLGHRDALGPLREALSGFAGIPGVFVNGSNDYFGPEVKNPFRYLAGPSAADPNPTRLDTAALESFLTDGLGWVNLNNRAARVAVAGRSVEFFGVDDPHRHFDNLDQMGAELDALRASTDGSIVTRIGVAHAPYQRILNALTVNGADVIFAGHTHGGQVCVPGYGALVTNCDLPRSAAKGLTTWKTGARTSHVHVSAGLGTSIYAPVRFACRPEVTLVTLVPSNAVVAG